MRTPGDYTSNLQVDPRLLRPVDVGGLCGDASRAKIELAWEPRVGLEQLAAMMVDADLVG